MDEPGRTAPNLQLAPDAGTERTMSIEERLRRLDRIVAALDAQDVELERSLALFEEGVRHVRAAERILADAELRVEELIGDEVRRRNDVG